MQTVALRSRINQLEDTIALQSRTSQQAMNANQSPTGSESFRGLQVPQSFAPLSQELNGADFRTVSAMPSGTSSASHMDSEMLQRTGAPQAGLKAVPEGDKLMMLSGDEFVKERFWEKSLDPSPVGRMHSQSPPPMTLQAQSSPTSALETQVALMSSQLNVLANAVQGIVNHASSGRTDKPRSSGKPPSSPGPSSSSSSNLSGKSSKGKKPGKGGSDGGGSSPGGSPSGSGASSPSRSPIAKEGIDAYALEKKLMRVKTYESLKLPTLPKNASEARTFKKRPSSSAIRSLLFEQLKNHPSMMVTTDKFRNASSGSSKRTYQWLCDKLIEAIEIHQLEENSSNLEKSLSQFAKVAANPSKPEKADS